MKKYDAIFWLLINLILVSCTFSTPTASKIQELTNIPRTVSPIFDHSFITYWQMVDQPSAEVSEFSIIVYAMKLTSQNTLIVCSTISDLSDVINQPDTTIQLRDNITNAKLLSKSILNSLGNLDFWVMDFEPRNLNSNEIYLHIGQSESIEFYDELIAQLKGPVEDPYAFPGRTYLIGASQTFEQDDYRISFYGWAPPPAPVMPTPSQVPEDINIKENATVEIKNIMTGKINYIAIQFLSNGQTISKLIN